MIVFCLLLFFIGNDRISAQQGLRDDIPVDTFFRNPYLEPIDPELDPINVELPPIPDFSPVLQFAGDFDVSSCGAATYTIPIEVPVGVGGMQPALSLTYDSQSSFGLAGLGFNVKGLGQITRGPKSVFYDGMSSGTNYQNNDAFYLNGERLILVDDSDGSYAVYRLNTDPTIKVIYKFGSKIITKDGKVSGVMNALPVWQVITKDGTVYSYDTCLSSNYKSSTRLYSWYLSSVVDKIGNYMSVQYENRNYYLYPISITYGKNQNVASSLNNVVTIKYEDLNSSSASVKEYHRFALGDVVGELSRRIKSIECKSGDTVCCEYLFNYDKIESKDLYRCYSVLSSLHKKQGSKMASIIFKWQDKPKGFNMSSRGADIKPYVFPETDLIKYQVDGDKQHLAADMNGDGVSDIIEIYEFSKKESKDIKYRAVVIYASNIDEKGGVHYEKADDNPILLKPVSDKISGGKRKQTKYSTQFADLNGDGYLDLIIPYYQVCVDDKAKYYTSKFIYNLDYFVLYGSKNLSHSPLFCYDSIYADRDNSIKSCNIPTIDCASEKGKSILNPSKKSYNWTLAPLYATFDIDNDGKTEMLTIEPYKANDYGCRCYIKSRNDSNSIDTHVCFLNFRFTVGSRLFCSDYNNDGMIDIMVVTADGCYIFYNKGKENAYFTKDASAHSESLKINQDEIIREGDFDGDGNEDYFYVKGSKWYIAYGDQMRNGSGDDLFHNVEILDSKVHDRYNISDDDDKFTVIVYDANNDGLSDIFVSKTQYEVKKTLNGNKGKNPRTISYILCSTGNRIQSADCPQFVTQFYKEYDGVVDKAVNWALGDFLGTGRPSLLHYSDDYEHIVFSGSKYCQSQFMVHTCTSDRKALKLLQIKDAMANTIDVNYEPLTNGHVYSDGSSVEFPVISHPLPLDVVSSVMTSNGILPSVTTTCRYKGMRIHMQGLGVLGFEERSVADKSSGMTTINRVESYDSQYYLPKKTSSMIVVSKDGEKYETKSSMTFVMDEIPDGKGTKFYHQKRKEDTDIYGNTSYVDYEYDITNAVLKKEKSYFKGEEKSMYKLVEYFYPSNKTYKGALLPERISTTQKHKDDSKAFTLWTKFVYNPDGLLSLKIDNYNQNNSNQGVKTMFEYDAFGNTIKTTVSGSDIKTISTINKFDETGRFVVKKYTEPLSKTVEKTYDVFGKCITSTEYDDEEYKQTTTYKYDDWGNLIETTSPDGNVTRTLLRWENNLRKRYYELTEAPHAPWVKTWYDTSGREIEVESVGAMAIAINTKISYDDRGQIVERNSNVGDRRVTDTFKYDAYGRMVKSESSTGEIATTCYANRSVTVNDGKKTVKKKLDSWGNPTSVEDGECDVTYKYNSNGNPSVIKSGSDITRFEYDEVGNKKSMTTSDRGTVIYKYNVLGECVYTKEDNRICQNTMYDELGRVIEKKTGTYVTKYEYGKSGAGANLLTSKSLEDSKGNVLSYSTFVYDNYKRLKCKYEYGKSMKVFRTEYEYNSFGEVQNISRWISEKNISLSIGYVYDDYGNKIEISYNDYMSGLKPVWRLSKYTGKYVSLSLLGCDGLESEKSFDDAGSLVNSHVSYRGYDLTSLFYTYDPSTGNMNSRSGMLMCKEMFDYDDNNRLTNYVSLNGKNQYVDYSENGNIIYKSDLGSYRYQNASKPHRLTQLDNEETSYPLDTRTINYNVWNRVSRIKDTETGYEMQLTYDDEGNRNWSKLTKYGALVRETEYIGCLEHVKSKTADEYFVYLDDNLLYHFNDHVSECLYLCTDHLGSVVKIVNEHGDAYFEAMYDAWGNQEVVTNTIGFIRGYAGHEEMPEFGLVNMNARLYDPMLGRFLSPDNYVQMPEDSQNFNRYSYCLNNPLRYVDPSGNSAVLVGTIAFALLSSACETVMWHGDFGSFALNFGVKMLGVAGGSAIGSVFGHTVGSVWNEALRAGAHGLFNGFMNSANGGDFLSGFAAGAVSSSAGSLAQCAGMQKMGVIVLSTVTGCLASGIVEGGDGSAFLNGAEIGFNIGAFNHCNGFPDWYENENGELRWFSSTEEELKVDGHLFKNMGHTLTRNGMYYSLFGQIYKYGSPNYKAVKLIDEGVMKTARWSAEQKSCSASNSKISGETLSVSLTDFSSVSKDTGLLHDHAMCYDYGGGTQNACVTWRKNPADMLVSAGEFSTIPIRGIKGSKYHILFTPRDGGTDVVRVWFGRETGARNYEFFTKLVDSYR